MNSMIDALRERLASLGQEHVLVFWDQLSQDEQDQLIKDVASVDLEHLASLCVEAREAVPESPSRVEPLPQVTKGEDPEGDTRAGEVGWEMLREGKICAFTVAGGQGTRLGFDGPKGTYPAGAVTGHSLFQLFAEKLRAVSRRAGRVVPWYIMTSPINDGDTRAFFAGNGWFGLEPEDVMFLQQGTMPAVDEGGRLILESKNGLCRSPDGHGGSLRALSSSGALADMKRRGVEEIYYFQVDNPLLEMCDPVFMGYHRESGSEFSSKSVPKREPGEKVGVLVSADGKPGVIEYSDLADDLRHAREEDGRLRFRAGNIAVHGISRAFVERLNEGGFALPHHFARKNLRGIGQDGTPTEIPGIKFETFVFDALPLAERVMLMEVDRASEFSPIKNREGADSASSSKAHQSAMFASWLEAAGVDVSRTADGGLEHLIEVSPLFAGDRDELLSRKGDLPSRIDGDTFIQ